MTADVARPADRRQAESVAAGGGWRLWAHSIQGPVRREQQDAFAWVADRRGIAAAVFDGVGGHPNGRQAAQAAASCFREQLRGEPRGAGLVAAMSAAAAAAQGSTTCIAVIARPEPQVVSVGDSMLWGWQGNAVRLNPVDSRHGMLTDWLGHPGVRGHVIDGPGHDRLLLCSDGVSDVVPQTLEGVVHPDADPAEVMAHLMDAVEAAGAPDNATALLMVRVR